MSSEWKEYANQNTKWHFVTCDNKSDSEVTKRLREEEPAFPFFSWSYVDLANIKYVPGAPKDPFLAL